MKGLRIFIGYDEREAIAYHVAAHSIITRASIPVSIAPLRREALRDVYTRPRTDLESTDFSMTRFLVPYLCGYEGVALFIDCDMLCRVDIAELLCEVVRDQGPDGYMRHAVLVCQHNYEATTGTKFLGQKQTAYPRKNWSSVMVFNNARCKALTPEYVNTASGLDLHRFHWLHDRAIGSLPLVWNWLVGEYAPNPAAKVLHYTLGGPWFASHLDCDHADDWVREYEAMAGTLPWYKSPEFAAR